MIISDNRNTNKCAHPIKCCTHIHAGQQLLVVRQGPEAIYAVGKRRQLNCGVLCLPHGKAK